jgi:uncharacterized Zn-binding protein involved in type VI secretion
MSTGHQDYWPRECLYGNNRVRSEGHLVHCVGDPWPIHCNHHGDCHGGYTCAGSSRVRIGGIPVARNGDPISCGDHCLAISFRVGVGG